MEADIAQTILHALTTGAAGGINSLTKDAVVNAGKTAGAAMARAKHRLVTLVKDGLEGDPKAQAALNGYLAAPTVDNAETLRAQISRHKLDDDPVVQSAAKQVLELVSVSASGAGGVATQNITQNNRPGSRAHIGGVQYGGATASLVAASLDSATDEVGSVRAESINVRGNANIGGIHTPGAFPRLRRSAQDAATYRDALNALDRSGLFRRRAALEDLRSLADRSIEWRQNCVDLICLALQNCFASVEPDREFAGEIRKILLSRIADATAPHSWAGCRFHLEDCTLDDFNLSGVRLVGGELVLSNVSIGSGGLNLSALELEDSAKVTFHHVTVHGLLNVRQLACRQTSSVTFEEVAVEQGDLDLSEALVSEDSKIRFSKTGVGRGSRLRLARAQISGAVSFGDLIVAGEDAIAEVNYMSRMEGSISFDCLRLSSGGLLSLDAIDLEAGTLDLYEVFVESASLGLRSQRIRHGSRVALHRSHLGGSSVIAFDGTRTESGSALLVDTHLEERSLLRMSGVENNEANSVFVLHATLHDPQTSVSITGGGNYGGHAHLIIKSRHGKRGGIFRLHGVQLFGGEVELSIAEDVQIRHEANRSVVNMRSGTVSLQASVSLSRWIRLTQGQDITYVQGLDSWVNHFEPQHESRRELRAPDAHEWAIQLAAGSGVDVPGSPML